MEESVYSVGFNAWYNVRGQKNYSKVQKPAMLMNNVSPKEQN